MSDTVANEGGPIDTAEPRGRMASALSNAHFVELDLLLSQHLGLRRVAGARRQRLLADLSAHGFVTLSADRHAAGRTEEEVLEVRMTPLGRRTLRVWRMRVVRAGPTGEAVKRKTLRLFSGSRKM